MVDVTHHGSPHRIMLDIDPRRFNDSMADATRKMREFSRAVRGVAMGRDDSGPWFAFWYAVGWCCGKVFGGRPFYGMPAPLVGQPVEDKMPEMPDAHPPAGRSLHITAKGEVVDQDGVPILGVTSLSLDNRIDDVARLSLECILGDDLKPRPNAASP